MRLASSSITTTTNGSSTLALVAAGVSGQAGGPASHEGDGVVEQVGHGFEVVAGEAGEQGPTGPEFHAPFGVDGPDLHGPGGDGRAQAPDQRPQHRALARPGDPGHQDVRAGHPHPPGGAVLDHPDGHGVKVNRARDGQGGVRRRRGGRGGPVRG